MKQNLIELRDNLWNQSKNMIGNQEARKEVIKKLFRVRGILLKRYGPCVYVEKPQSRKPADVSLTRKN